MSIRTYNSTTLYGRFRRPTSVKPRSKVDYTDVYKTDSLPSHDVEVVRQYAET